MSGFRTTLCLVLGALLLALWPGAAHAQKRTLVVALNQDPDVLDPTLARSYVGRIVFAHICEKLYEIDENLRIYPQLAADMPAVSDAGRTVTIRLRRGVKFNDGTPMDAEAVRFSLDRHRTLKGSSRRSELDGVAAVEVVDPETIRLRLKTPLSPLAAILTDRAGMPVSPAAVQKLGDKFGTAPVCVGPWQFVERLPQDAPPEFQAPPIQIAGHAPRPLPGLALELGQPRTGGRHAAGRFRPADAVVDDLLGVLRQVVQQTARQRRRQRGRPPHVGRQVADQQLAHGEGQLLRVTAARLERHLLGADLALAPRLAPDAQAGPQRQLVAGLAHQQQHASGVDRDDVRHHGREFLGVRRAVAVNHQVGEPGPQHGRGDLALARQLPGQLRLDFGQGHGAVGALLGRGGHNVLHWRLSRAIIRSASTGPQVPPRYSGRKRTWACCHAWRIGSVKTGQVSLVAPCCWA